VDHVVTQGDPVTDRGKVGATGRTGAKARRDFGVELSGFGIEDVASALLDGNARRRDAFGRVGLELGCELVGPAQFLQVQLGTSVARVART
jgi:hypothetical protein